MAPPPQPLRRCLGGAGAGPPPKAPPSEDPGIRAPLPLHDPGAQRGWNQPNKASRWQWWCLRDGVMS